MVAPAIAAMLPLLTVCIVGLALITQGSSGHGESSAPPALPSNPPSETHGPAQVQDPSRSTSPSLSIVAAAAPIPEVVVALEPSASPDIPNVNPPVSASPPQPALPEPPASSVSPTLSPPFEAAPPQPLASPSAPVLPAPSIASSPPPASLSSPPSSLPSKASPPLPSFLDPSPSPSSPTLSPPLITSPPQPTFHEPPPSPRLPILPPLPKETPPQPIIPEPPASPSLPTLSPPFIASPPQSAFPEPPPSTSSPTLSPPSFAASPPQPALLPPTSPSTPTLSPPPLTASPQQPRILSPPKFPSSPAFSPPRPSFDHHVPLGKTPAPEKNPDERSPVPVPIVSGSVVSPPPNLGKNQSDIDPYISPSTFPAPIKSPITEHSAKPPATHAARQREPPNNLPAHPVAPSNFDRGRDKIPVAVPPSKTPNLPPPIRSPGQAEAPFEHENGKHIHHASPPSMGPANSSSGTRHQIPAPLPSSSSHNEHRQKVSNSATTSDQGAPLPSEPQAAMPPSLIPTSRRTTAPPPVKPVIPRIPMLPHFHALPPPPPNEDCVSTVCTEPYTNTPPGSPCGCVLPMQIGLQLSVPLYTFFPLVSELAAEISVSIFMKQSQVRIMGANAASQQPEKTIVLIDLVPLGEKFDPTTATLTSERFWHKQVMIKNSYFGDYDVLYVIYPGLPPSPPLPPSNINMIDGGPYSASNNAGAIKPLGVDVSKRRHKGGLSGGVIAVIALSVFVAIILCSAVSWIFLFKRKHDVNQRPTSTPRASIPSLSKPSGNGGSMVGSGPSSTSMSFGSSIAAYRGTARTFSMNDIERATDKFNASRVVGEGGFGLVYHGVLDDGINVAVKVLKRDDQQGGREFLAEVEMLSRLHHRNLVKLIGICSEDRTRCLVYELIPNGSVESHLHGIDKEIAPLDWRARMKIALGAARGLAYLHEDSSPRVIHRDFKSSNILLEHDFTPKVSDFGLARSAMDEENSHISTRVMGTFGYLAPEYAMTGHLLVKSDVYSYGVVLLELLTGRKPVDMSQPSGQENLVAWARPLLTSKEGLDIIVDPSLRSEVPFDSIAKVAAIASMCVQPEVSNRPFMGEVVQALKLVCNECEEANEAVTRTSSMDDDISMDLETGASYASSQVPDTLERQYSIGNNFPSTHDIEGGYSASELFSSSARYPSPSSPSLRRMCSSGTLRTGRNRQFWRVIKQFSGGSVSEHGMMLKLWNGSH